MVRCHWDHPRQRRAAARSQFLRPWWTSWLPTWPSSVPVPKALCCPHLKGLGSGLPRGGSGIGTPPSKLQVYSAPLRFHDLRHTHASWLIAKGAHAKAIQERLGHSSITVTMATYGHLMPEIDEGLADMLDADMRDARKTTDAYAVGRT